MASGQRRHGIRRFGLQVLGWVLVVAGVAMLVLPGPGLLGLAAGLVVLSQQYRWARQRLEPVKNRAFQAAAEGVRTRSRIAISCVSALVIVAVGIAWILQPRVPGWWPIAEGWWLPGGAMTGTTLILSGMIALGFIFYSVRRFRHQ